MFAKVTLVMVFDISVCNEIINETFEELCELGLTLESLVETSVEDVIWFLRLVGGNMIMDHTEHLNYSEMFTEESGKICILKCFQKTRNDIIDGIFPYVT